MAIDVVVPMLGIMAEKGKIIEWLKKEGDSVEKGEILFIVEVEKATVEVESPAAGILAKIIVQEGVEVAVKSVVGVITEPGEELPDDYFAELETLPQDAVQEEVTAPEPVPPPPTIETQPTVPATPVAGDGKIYAVPAARKLAADSGVNLAAVPATGPDGVVTHKDVEGFIPGQVGTIPGRVSPLARQLAQEEGISLDGVKGTGVRGQIMRADVERAKYDQKGMQELNARVIPMSTMRKVIARNMSESALTAPHVYFFIDICMDPLLDFRKKALPDFEQNFGIRPSINDFLIKAVSLNIQEFPIMNAQLKGDDIYIMNDINVCLAVALPEGLVVPALTNTDRAGIVDIVKQRTDLVERAREGKLTVDEMDRGTFTISSLASYHINYFTAIINPPQSAILTVGGTRENRTVVNGEEATTRVATFGISVDHRIIDGAVAAEFLNELKKKLERPSFFFLTL